tara:strand:+ start:445 stop:705 length:261 start_codon:yes stop_codon:yes gene_type:complete
MPLIKTKINKDSEKFISNYEYHKNLSSELSDKIKKIRRMGDLDKVEKHRSRGKLTARERIDKLKDKKTKFLELSEFTSTAHSSSIH